jgi:hypothetical protein
MILKTFIKGILNQLRRRNSLLKYPQSSPGSVDWLIGTENKYGGFASNVKRNKVSPKDPRSVKQIRRGGMTGGDRMLHHGYAKKYSEYLLPYVKKGESVTLVEFGILKGTGPAIWCDLFQNGRIIGLDIDLGHINGNMEHLKNLGAFRKNEPELYEVDQFLDNTKYLGTIMKNDRIDICIDDGFHSCESILNTMNSVTPYLSAQFVYFIEDNKDVHREIRFIYPNYAVDFKGEFTIITRH